jgi:hypothetical protein
VRGRDRPAWDPAWPCCRPNLKGPEAREQRTSANFKRPHWNAAGVLTDCARPGIPVAVSAARCWRSGTPVPAQWTQGPPHWRRPQRQYGSDGDPPTAVPAQPAPLSAPEVVSGDMGRRSGMPTGSLADSPWQLASGQARRPPEREGGEGTDPPTADHRLAVAAPPTAARGPWAVAEEGCVVVRPARAQPARCGQQQGREAPAASAEKRRPVRGSPPADCLAIPPQPRPG